MINPNQAPAMELQDPGVFARLETTFRNSRIGQLATIGIASLGMTAAAEAYTAEPASADNVPTTTATTTTTPDTTPSVEQECVAIGTARPKIYRPLTMIRPGIELYARPDGYGPGAQSIIGEFGLKLMPEGPAPALDCSGYHRLESYHIQMQSAQNRNKWVPLGKHGFTYVPSNAEDNIVDSQGYFINFTAGENDADLVPYSGPLWSYNQCVGGKGWLKVREIEELEVKDMQTGQIVGKRSYTLPVKVRGHDCAAARQSANLAAKYAAENGTEQN